MKKRKLTNPTDFQRQYEEIGLGTEEDRAYYGYTGEPVEPETPKEQCAVQWFTDERDIESPKPKDE